MDEPPIEAVIDEQLFSVWCERARVAMETLGLSRSASETLDLSMPSISAKSVMVTRGRFSNGFMLTTFRTGLPAACGSADGCWAVPFAVPSRAGGCRP